MGTIKTKLENCADFIPQHVIDWFQSEPRDKELNLIEFPSIEDCTGYICIEYVGNLKNNTPTFRASHQGQDIGYLKVTGRLGIYNKSINFS